MKLKEVELCDLETGDQIAVQGNVKDLHPSLVALTVLIGDTYLHHGIYCKEDCSVIEFHGEDKENARPKKRDFTKFYSGHDKLYRVEYEDGKCLSVNETMQRAKKAVEQGYSWPSYDLIKNNCESFASFLKTDVETSRQALEALLKIGIVISTAAVGSSLAMGVKVSGGSGNKRN